MKRLRELLLDGILLALPLGAAAFLLHRVIGLLARLLIPVAHLLPEGRWLGIAAVEIAAGLVLLVALLVLGAFSRTAISRHMVGTLETVLLSKLPGYMIMKSLAADFSGTGADAGLRPALVSFDDNTVLGFIVEGEPAGDLVTVFVPGAPSSASGSVVLMPGSRVRALDVPTGSAMKSMKQRGLGLQEIAQAKPPG